QGTLQCGCAASGQSAEPDHRPERLVGGSDGVWPVSPAPRHAVFPVDEETKKQLVVNLLEKGPSTSRKPRSCVLLGAAGPGWHAHSQKTPCSLARRVRERGKPCYGS